MITYDADMSHPDDDSNSESLSVRFNLLLRISDGENEEHQHEREEQFHTKRSAHCYIVQEHVSCQLLTVSSRGTAVNDARTADS